MRGLSWHPSGPLTPGDALEAGRVDAPRLLSGYLPWLLPITTASSHPRWLRPRRHAKEQDCAHAPDMVRQPRRHRWRLGLPPLGRTVAVGGQGLRQRGGYGGVWHKEIILHMIQCELWVCALPSFAEGDVASTDGGHMLADGE